jgi:hypothetical protein
MKAIEPTPEQRECVRVLRAAGVGKKRLARILGVQRDTLERRFGAELAEAAAAFANTQMPKAPSPPSQVTPCQICGRPVRQNKRGPRGKVCSGKCRNRRDAAARRARNER